MSELKGKTAIVTGSSRSVGAAIAKALAAFGADVVVNSRVSGEEAEQVARDCQALGVRSEAITADVSTIDGPKFLIDETIKRFGKVDIMVNNVGVSPRIKFLELSLEDWNKVFDINLRSAFLCTQHAVPSMIERRWGRVINISGHAHIHTWGTGVMTKASKAGLTGLTRGLAGELAQYNITTNEVAPSLMDTPPRRNKYYKDIIPNWDPVARGIDEVPLKRLGKPEELAGLVRFLCTEDASYITGQTHLVNGGLVAI